MSQLVLEYQSKTPNARQRVVSRPLPEPVAGELQVKIYVAAVNPVDWKIFDYGIFVTDFPNVIGSDGAGEVTKVAPDVTNFQVGDRIVFQGMSPSPNGRKGTFQQYCVVNAVNAAKIPQGMDYDSTSTIPVGTVTAAYCLYYHTCLALTPLWEGGEGVYKGQTIVVLGGSSSVGSYTIQLAVLAGFKVITTSSPAHFDYLRSLGAAAVIDRSSPNIVSELIAAAGGPVQYVIDSISLASTQEQGINILQSGGKLVLVLDTNEKTVSSALERDISVSSAYGSSPSFPDFFKGFWAAVHGYLQRGVLKPNKPVVLPGGLNAWKEAFSLHREGKISGYKIVLRPQETERLD